MDFHIASTCIHFFRHIDNQYFIRALRHLTIILQDHQFRIPVGGG